MKTVKLPYNCSIEHKDLIFEVQKQCSSMIKLAYNRFWDNLIEKEIRALSKTYKNIDLLNSWLIQCCIRKAKAIYEKDKVVNKKTVFGGKFNFVKRALKKISKEDFKLKTLLPICSQGEKLHKANRQFNFNLIENQVIFKLNKKQHIVLTLPKLRKNLKKEFNLLQSLIDNKEITISVELTQNYIYFTYDETILHKNINNVCKNIVAAVDLNPEYIGFSISHFKNDKQNIIFRQVYNLTYYTKNLKVSSNSKQSKRQVNKQKYELIQVCLNIFNICQRFHVGQFVIEDLYFKGEKKSRKFNRLCKNKWNKNIVVEVLKKHFSYTNIKFVEINPCYTSFIGNLIYNEPDMLAASLEIARRGYYKFQKGRFYPQLIKAEDLGNHWKEALNWTYSSWVELFKKVKTMGLKYRNSLKDYSFKVFRLNSSKSYINLYSFI